MNHLSATTISVMRSVLIAVIALAVMAAEVPAQRRLAYARAGIRPGQPQLFIAAADGSDERPLFATPEDDYNPVWSPRGDLVMFARLSGGAYQPGGSYDIYTIRPDGTGLKRLTNGQGNDAHMSWSFDGQYIAFASTRMGFKDEVAYTDAPQSNGEIFVMRFDGTGVEQLTDNQWEEGTPGWQPDSR